MKKLFVLLAVFLLPIVMSRNASAFSRPEDHVVAKGKVFNEIKNVSIDKIRVYALKKGKLKPIPFQIDKLDVEGKFIFSIAEEREKAEDRIEAYEDAKDEEDVPGEKLAELKRRAMWVEDMKLFDAEDELVFMAWDLGRKASINMFPKNSKIEELAVTNPIDSSTAYAYVALFNSNPPPLSPVKYVNYDPKNDIVDADYYMVKFDKEHPHMFTENRLKDANGTLGENFVDRMKMRFKIDIKWFVTMNFDEENTSGKLIAYKFGPVRVIRRMLFWLELMYIQVIPSATVDFVFFPNGIIAPGEINMPVNPKTFFNDESNLIAGVDFSDLFNGSKMYTKKTSVPVIMDGKMSEAEKALDLKNQNWFVLYKDTKYGIFAQMVFDKRLKIVKSDIWYLDDKSVIMEPEEIPGQHILAYSMGLTQFPSGKYSMNMYMYMDRKWERGMEKRFLNFIANPLKCRAKKIK